MKNCMADLCLIRSRRAAKMIKTDVKPLIDPLVNFMVPEEIKIVEKGNN